MIAFLEKHKNFAIFFGLMLVFKVATYFNLPSFYKVGVGVIMASLVGFYNTSVARQHVGVLIGMIFLLFGDAFQLFNNSTFITIAFVCYMIAAFGFIARFRTGIRNYKLPKQPILLGLPIILLASYAMFASSYFDNKILFVVFGIGFALMTTFAILRNEKVKGYHEVIGGTFLFGIYGLLQLLQFSGFGFHQTILIVLHAMAVFLMVVGVIMGSKMKEQKV